MLMNDYEIRYYINKTESDKEILQGLQMLEQHILQQLRNKNNTNKITFEMTRENLYAFEIPPDFYIGYMSSMNRQSNQIKLDLTQNILGLLLKNCLDPNLRQKLFNEFLNVNKNSENILNQLIEVRDQFSNKLGFKDYLEYSLELNSKFFNSNNGSNYQQKMLIQNLSEQLSKLNNSNNNQNTGIDNNNSNNINNNTRITLQRMLNNSVERCHKKLDQLFSDKEFYQNLLEKAQYKNINDKQIQLSYADLLYLRQKILATPLYKFTLKWNQVFYLLNQITMKYFNIQFKEIQSPNNHFYNRISDNLNNIDEDKDQPQQEKFKQENQTNQNQQNNNVFEKNIRCYEIIQDGDKRKGIIYIDFNAYEDAKTCFSSGYCEINKYKQLPILLMRMNFKIINDDTEITFDNFQTFMHEIGHSLHSIMNTHRYQLYANNYKIDYAEISAKIFENLVFLLDNPSQDNKDNNNDQQKQNQQQGIDFIFQKPFQYYIELFRIMSQLETIYYSKLDLFMHEKQTNNNNNNNNNDENNSMTLKEFSYIIQKNIFKSLINNHDNYWFCNLSHLDEYSGLYFSYAIGEEVFYELQDKSMSFNEQQKFIQQLFTSAHL